ncbi:MAG: hypothetical protein NZ529_05570 [Cytophagaceae bacterium]|nr:hypothetical protein [Cytophagaceae bacterium]MDW8456245.1 hypothetical protein [Cytophagaceae bacterium]
MKKKGIVLFAFLVLYMRISGQDTEHEQKVEALLNNFMNALLIADENVSAKEVMKYTHSSLHNANGTDLSDDLRRFSFKKAHENAKLYHVPVKIVKIRKTSSGALGSDKGDFYEYYISKKNADSGLPSPIRIFISQSGGEPKITYMGGL